MRKRAFLLTLCLFVLLPLLSVQSRAADLDEILLYEINVDVNDDATLHLYYHIEWKVLDSDSEGPLSWVLIGIPNSHCESLRGRSAAVRKIAYNSDSGSNVRIDLDRDYYAGEVVDIEFELVQDYVYQVDRFTEGETVYNFTPGWFDSARVDRLTLRWNAERAISQTPSCLVDKGYYVWDQPLEKGEKLTVTVTYPNDAFAFDVSKSIEEGIGEGDDTFFMVVGGIVMVVLMAIPGIIIAAARAAFGKTANFGSGTQTKITRTKVVYHPTCPGCGAPRPDGANNCSYCGRSFIKSEEVIKEDEIPAEEKDLRGKKTDGLYRYSSQPDTYIRVHVTHVPVPRSSHSSSSRGGGYHSSCAHSSCACACACACAGGGRAGCTTKDFYRTDLKLRQLEAKKRA